jgi:hypothetical protein
MTTFTYSKLRENKGAKFLKKNDIVDWGNRRDLIINECNSHEYPLTAIRRIGELPEKVSFQIVHYRVEPVFKEDLQFYFGPVIRAEQRELYQRAEKRMTAAGITNTTEAQTIQDDWRRAKGELNLLKLLEE